VDDPRRYDEGTAVGRATLVRGDLDGGPLELDSSFVVTLSARAGKVSSQIV
jgi:hypothetical protein